MSMNADFIIKGIPQFNYVIDEKSSTDEVVVLRSNLEVSDVGLFLSDFQKLTNANFRRFYEKKKKGNPRNLFHKKWVCQHSSYNKKGTSTKNAHCKAFVDILVKKVNRNTVKNDPFLKSDVALPCIIKLHLTHSHSTQSADALRRLDVAPVTKHQFEQYFLEGLKPAKARGLHESSLIAESGSYLTLAKSDVNPTQSQVYYMYNKWRNGRFGSHSDPFTTLKERLQQYESEGITVTYNAEHPWAVCVITPVMHRCHGLATTGEIIFLDSTSGCDESGATLTVLLSSTKAGGIPLAVLIHESLSTESYTAAFKLLKSTAPLCFGQKEAPDIFMTDDSLAEKNALAAVWPSAQQLLCHFHVAQAEWRWLMSASSDVSPEDRREVMNLFQNVMYARTQEDFLTAVEKIDSSCQRHPAFLERFHKYLERRKEWVSLYRNNILTRNNNTNNLCESSMRIMKDIVLSRTKAFNVVALVDFCSATFNNYLITKILKYAYNRSRKNTFLYEDLLKNMNNVHAEDIQQVEENVYMVPSNSQANIRYLVEASVGYCTCLTGKTGAFCKHQCFLLKHKKVSLPNAPVLSSVDRYNLATLALGKDAPDLTFFIGLDEDVQAINADAPCSSSRIQICNSDDELAVPNLAPEEENVPEKVPEEDKLELKREFNRILEEITPKNATKLLKCMRAVKSRERINEKILKVTAVLAMKRRKIGVQPTSISRRRNGSGKGTNPMPVGRPTSKRERRKHNLKLNIKQNVANAK